MCHSFFLLCVYITLLMSALIYIEILRNGYRHVKNVSLKSYMLISQVDKFVTKLWFDSVADFFCGTKQAVNVISKLIKQLSFFNRIQKRF